MAQEYEDQEKREMRGSWRIGAPEQSVSISISAALRASFLVLDRLDRTPSSPDRRFV